MAAKYVFALRAKPSTAPFDPKPSEQLPRTKCVAVPCQQTPLPSYPQGQVIPFSGKYNPTNGPWCGPRRWHSQNAIAHFRNAQCQGPVSKGTLGLLKQWVSKISCCMAPVSGAHYTPFFVQRAVSLLMKQKWCGPSNVGSAWQLWHLRKLPSRKWIWTILPQQHEELIQVKHQFLCSRKRIFTLTTSEICIPVQCYIALAGGKALGKSQPPHSAPAHWTRF